MLLKGGGVHAARMPPGRRVCCAAACVHLLDAAAQAVAEHQHALVVRDVVQHQALVTAGWKQGKEGGNEGGSGSVEPAALGG